jgi:hypothetical protein
VSEYVWCVPWDAATQFAPWVSQSYHWYRNRFGLPDQLPFVVLSRWPTYGEPESAGATMLTGTCPYESWPVMTCSVACDRAAPVPKSFDALTTTRIR